MKKQVKIRKVDQSSVIEQLYYIDEMLYEIKRGKDLDSFADRAIRIFRKISDWSILLDYYTVVDFSKKVTSLIKDMKTNNLHTNKVFNEVLIIARFEILDQLEHYNDGLCLLRNVRGDALINTFRDQLKLGNEICVNSTPYETGGIRQSLQL